MVNGTYSDLWQYRGRGFHDIITLHGMISTVARKQWCWVSSELNTAYCNG